MSLSRTNVSLAVLLDLMEKQEPESIHLNHVLIEEGMETMPFYATLEHLPTFTVNIGGFVEIEFVMDLQHEAVQRLMVRQSAMTFDELDTNGDVLPNLTIDTRVLSDEDRTRLDLLAKRYIEQGKILDKARAEALITEYVGKAMFCPKKYRGVGRG